MIPKPGRAQTLRLVDVRDLLREHSLNGIADQLNVGTLSALLEARLCKLQRQLALGQQGVERADQLVLRVNTGLCLPWL